MKEHQGPDKIVEVSRVVAESDMKMLKQLGVASDNVSLGTKYGVSILGDSSHATQGQSSVRSQNTQQRRRNLEEKYIPEAEAQEAAAAQRWKDIAFAATSVTGLYSPTPNNQQPKSSGDTPSTNSTAPSTPQSSPSPRSQPNNHTNNSVPPSGEPASSKQSGLGNNTSSSAMGEAAEGPQGAQ
jgi:hypothetical protein